MQLAESRAAANTAANPKTFTADRQSEDPYYLSGNETANYLEIFAPSKNGSSMFCNCKGFLVVCTYAWSRGEKFMMLYDERERVQ